MHPIGLSKKFKANWTGFKTRRPSS